MTPATDSSGSESTGGGESKHQARERLKIWQTVCLIVLTALLACLLARFESLFELESVVRNLAATVHHAREKDLARIVIVVITPGEYRDDFNSTSPLDPNRLIEDLIGIARAHPRAVAIDIDTSHPDYLRHGEGQSSPAARLDTETSDWRQRFVWALPSYQKADRTFAPTAVLGQRPPPGSALWKASGVTAFPIDSDGYVRTYLRQFITNQGRLNSLAYALARRTLPEPAFDALQADDRKRLLGLWGRQLPDEMPALRDKIVIVGGTYDIKDQYPTAQGKLFGVQIIADALQTEAEGGGPTIFSASESMLSGAVIGTMLAVAYATLGPLAGLSITFCAAAGLLLVFKYEPEFYGIGSLFPIPVVFLLLYLYHLIIDYQDKIIHRVHGTLRNEHKRRPDH
jgi:CHASE2 domain-containing sensor protein